MPKIGFWKRAIAILIDFILLKSAAKVSLLPLQWNIDFDETMVTDIFQGIGTQQNKEFLLYFILYFIVVLILSLVYFTYFHASTGQTIGKKFLKIKVIQTSGEPLNYKIAFIRWAGYLISEFAIFLGFIWVVFDKNKQGWHDKIAGTYVVKTRGINESIS